MSERADPVLLDAVLRPVPPLASRTLLVILMLVAAINIAFAVAFVLRGAWPIAPFMGLDVALLAWAFRASRIAARREERVTLTPSVLRVVRRPPRGDPREFILNPYWVRVELDETPPSRLTLWSHGKGLRLGMFLPPAERASFAQRLKQALKTARMAQV